MEQLEAATPTIAAVIVAFNRKDMLARCLDGLLSQTRPVDHVFVVNNASTDGTREFLDERYGQNAAFTLCHMDTNTGGAGGFNKGMEIASQQGFDWYWMMDDDVIPRPDCLGKLLEYTSVSQCIHPRKQYEDGSFFNWYGNFSPVSGRLKPASEDNLWSVPAVDVNYGCFEGMLVSDAVVKSIGLPDKDYFICYDDRIYGYKASRHTRVLYLRDAIMDKLIKKDPNVFSAFSFYYQVRNLFLLKRDLQQSGDLKFANWLGYVGFFLANNLRRGVSQKGGGMNVVKVAWKGLRDGVSL